MFLLAKVALQQAFEGFAVTGLVASHLIECSTSFRIRKSAVSQGFWLLLL